MADSGVLMVWTDVAAETDALFNGWYNRQHLSEWVNVPGFRNGRRYRAVQGAPAYLAWCGRGWGRASAARAPPGGSCRRRVQTRH